MGAEGQKKTERVTFTFAGGVASPYTLLLPYCVMIIYSLCAIFKKVKVNLYVSVHLWPW